MKNKTNNITSTTEVKLGKLQARAKEIGMNVWEHGGYYYMSGFIRGKHRQGTFTTLEQIIQQLVYEERWTK